MRDRVEAVAGIAGQQFELCIIGGGATGAACALDAQLRGIRTVLLEAADFGAATSTASTKIIHGGVRYLEEAIRGADLKEYRVLVRALHERVRMLDNAPHLTRRLRFLVPSYSWISVLYLDIGLKIYDWLAGPGRIASSKFLSRDETLRRMPGVQPRGLKGAVAYYDGQFDDARYNLALVQSFVQAGGSALNYARVTDFVREEKGRISGVLATDHVSRKTFPVLAKAVVNATGPFSDQVRRLATPTVGSRMRPSKGAHVLLPLQLFPSDEAMLIPKTEDGRVLFALPWSGRLLVGTTDEEVSPEAEMVVTSQDVDYILRQLNQYVSRPVTPDDVVSGFAGARPLVSEGEKAETKSLARDDVIEVDAASGLISIMGGKWTTHRAMAEDTINRVQQVLGLAETPCRTGNHVLHGGEGFTQDYWQKLCREFAVPEATARHLTAKFGTAAEDVLAIARENPALSQPIVAGYPAIRAEVIYAVRQEMAMTIEDVLARRIGLQLYSWRDAMEAAPLVGGLMAAELGWDADFTRVAIGDYVAHIRHLLESAGLTSQDGGSKNLGAQS